MTHPPSTRRKLIYASIPTVALLVLVAALELGLRAFGVRFADDPYLNLALSVSVFEEEERDGIRWYRVWHPQAYGVHGLSFPVEKPDGAFRVFCLGGSACAGWPHPAGEDFGTYLAGALRKSFPDRPIEVLNVAAHGFASYRVRDVFDDVVEFDPDLLVIWSGNNEFYEKRTYLGTPRTLVQSSYVLRLATVCADRWLRPENSLSAWGTDPREAAMQTWRKIEGIAQELRTDAEQLRQVTEHYRWSIEHMLTTASKRRIPTIVLAVPSNLRDWGPNVSGHDLDPEAEAEWRSELERGHLALLDNDAETAARSLAAAAELSPRHARTHFLLGKAHDALKQHDRADREYLLAKEHDLNPFRALSAFNDAVREIAARCDGVILLDAEAAFREAAGGRAPGFDLFLDYVHPNRRGNMLVAERVFREIVAHDLLGVPPIADFTEVASEYDEQGDLLLGWQLVVLSTVMRQYESVVAYSDRMLDMIADGRSFVRPGSRMTKPEYTEFFRMAKRVHEEYLRADRQRMRGETFDPEYESRLRDAHRTRFFPDIFASVRTREDAVR